MSGDNTQKTTAADKHVPSSYIKDVSIEIDEDYIFDNSPTDIKKPGKSIFIGRSQASEKFLSFLQSTSKKGTFLVTGFRGMGKTSFVNRAVYQYKKKEKKATPIHLSLAQRNPKEFDILKMVTSKIYEEYKKKSKAASGIKLLTIIETIAFILIVPSIIALLVLAIGNYQYKAGFRLFQVFADDTRFPLSRFLIILKITSLLFVLSFLICKPFIYLWEHYSSFAIIKQLYERCYASVSVENSKSNEISISSFLPKISSSSFKKNKIYPIAQSKEIEHELAVFFEKTHKKVEFILVFDELDKVDPAISTAYYYDDGTVQKKENEEFYLKELRDRKQAILNIIAGLKNFLTTAKARFIFIAGREMFDASLADIADRQSSISSIFNYVFNIDSFLKENLGGRGNSSSLSLAVEEYLIRVLFAEKIDNSRSSGQGLYELFRLHYKTLPENDDNMNSAVFMLQNFVIYLTYRSNGSPKKLIQVLHEFMRNDKISASESTIFLINNLNDDNVRKKNKNIRLHFNLISQYKIGFINYLYRPFLVKYGRSFKNYSDNILVAVPYLFDHLIKFHPFAFSVSNLELIPEVLSTNKTPSLREHILQIISYLGNNHLRETEIGLFNYKFYSRTYKEIVFISKTLEEESAAFNFTLDEGYLVKVHVRSKLRELRGTYEKFSSDPDKENQQIFSIAHLNDVLGDLHFFDQEFDDAIVAYSDAIKPINNLIVGKMNMRDFITLIRSKLKLGLTFEKMSSYDESLAFYSDACQDAKRFISSRLSGGKNINLELEEYIAEYTTDSNNKPSTYHTSALNDVLQIINQCFLAKLVIEEKMGMEGVATQKIGLAFGAFMTLAEGVGKVCGKNNLIISNFYLIAGNLLYYKNSNRLFINIDDTKKRDECYERSFKNKLPLPVYNELVSVSNFLTDYFETTEENKKTRKPLAALNFYILGLNEILKSRETEAKSFKIAIDANNTSVNIYTLIHDKLKDPNEFGQVFNKGHYRHIAAFLSNIGDCLLSMVINNEKHYKSYEAIELLKYPCCFDPEKSFTDYFYKPTNQLKIPDVLCCFYLAAQYFSKAGKSVSSSFQYRKIMHVLRLVLKDNSSPLFDIYILRPTPLRYQFPFSQDELINGNIKLRKTRGYLFEDINNIHLPKEQVTEQLKEQYNQLLLKVIQTQLLTPSLLISSENAEHSDRHMILKYERQGVKKEDRGSILRNVSNNPETKEIIYLFFYIEAKILSYDSCCEKKYYNQLFKNPSIASQYTRLYEVDLHAKITMIRIKNLESKFIEEGRPTLKSKLDQEFIKVCCDYLFDMNTILRVLMIYGTDYLVSYSIQAHTHFRIAEFLDPSKGFSIMGKNFTEYWGTGIVTDNVKDEDDTKATFLQLIINRLIELLQRRSFALGDHIYHYSMAKHLYQKAIQLHTAGNEYKKVLNNLIYLEDDFNDNAYHFGAAIERYMMINGVFEQKINHCQTILSAVADYGTNGYFNPDIPSNMP